MESPTVKLVARVLLLVLALGLAPGGAAATSDDEFIASLGDETAKEPVDRKRLARIFFSLAATLDGGKSSVRLLHGNLVVPDASRQAVQSLVRQRFGDYERSLARFRASATRWLDEPESLLLLHRAVTDGQRACWHFDLHNRLIESYGSSSALRSILSSRQACVRLRTAAFQPRVEAIVVDALVRQVYQRQEIVELEQELQELEELLRELQRIDEGE
jgi:hypothetical protein